MIPRQNSKEDRRIFERFASRFPAKYNHPGNEYGTDLFLRDASAEGVKLTTSQRVFINDNVSLMVKMPDGEDPMLLSGRVVWLKEKSPRLWDFGLQFHKINFMQIQRIYKFAKTPSYIF